MLNHVPGCLSLHSKKHLFHNINHYYKKYIPFHLESIRTSLKSFLSLFTSLREHMTLSLLGSAPTLKNSLGNLRAREKVTMLGFASQAKIQTEAMESQF